MKKWVMTRLSEETYKRLTDYVQSIHRANKKRRHWFGLKPGPVRRSFSNDDAVSLLLDQVEAHRERAKRSTKAKSRSQECIQLAIAENGVNHAP